MQTHGPGRWLRTMKDGRCVLLAFTSIMVIGCGGPTGAPTVDPYLADTSGFVFPGDAWQEATCESQGVDSAKLKMAVDYLADGVSLRPPCGGPAPDDRRGLWRGGGGEVSRYGVEVEATYRAVVVVEARTRDEARRMAERGPDAWLDPAPVLEHLHTEPGETWRQDEAGEDEMQSLRDREDARREGIEL